MFENYIGARTHKQRKWIGLTVSMSAAIHALALTAFIVHSFWVIDKLPVPEERATIGGPPPPPPPPPPAGSSKPKVEEKRRLLKVEEPVQPTKKPQDMDRVEVVSSHEAGVEGGVEGGVAGGVVGGVIGGVEGGVLGGIGDAPPPPPPAPQEPQIVPQAAIEQQRIAGEAQIAPTDDVKLQIRRDGRNRVVPVVRMCLTASGGISSLNLIKSSGYPAYDRRILSKMREWRYRPFMVNEKAVPVCTSVTFIYTQTN
jgi:periplasmic protein TonB